VTGIFFVRDFHKQRGGLGGEVVGINVRCGG
jgi:hypothetical protein